MRAKEILSEGISAVVYHATSFPSAYKMLEADTMKGPEISFARSLGGAYHRGNKLIGIIFQIDGNKLNQNYKGKAVGTENFMWDDEDEYDPNDKDTWSHTGKDNGQEEDRVYSKNGIQNFSKYITKALAYAPKEYIDKSGQDEFGDRYRDHAKSAEQVIQQLTALSIPIRYVASEAELNKKNSNDPEGFNRVIQYALSGEYNDGSDKEWVATFADYSDYDEEDDFPHIANVTKTISAPDLKSAKAEAEKLANRDFMLTRVENEDTGEYWAD